MKNISFLEEKLQVKYLIKKLSIVFVSCVSGCVISFGSVSTVQAEENDTEIFDNNDTVLMQKGTIEYKGLNQQDVSPEIHLHNNASLNYPNTQPVGLGFDKVEDRYTFGIVDFDQTYSMLKSNNYKSETGFKTVIFNIYS
ncbi:hypothetical protein [Clostridium perfringens]|uniref:hypothetical protein n=1 Tax=Clostridium perfringens TaxID=1502 RepID=UPI003A0FE846